MNPRFTVTGALAILAVAVGVRPKRAGLRDRAEP
jgi:hypothetical protein